MLEPLVLRAKCYNVNVHVEVSDTDIIKCLELPQY